MALTADRVRDLFAYTADGSLIWREQDHRRKPGPVGTPAGTAGRLQVQVDGVAQYVHRLVWLYHHGVWPSGQIDHINGNPVDNRIENLRDVSAADNSRNRRHRGVAYDRRKVERPWRARIMVNGRSISLGYFDTEAEALAEYQRAKLIYHSSYRMGIAAT